jgi:hypothetical protein
MGTSQFPMSADPSTRVIQLEMASANYVPITDVHRSGGNFGKAAVKRRSA